MVHAAMRLCGPGSVQGRGRKWEGNGTECELWWSLGVYACRSKATWRRSMVRFYTYRHGHADEHLVNGQQLPRLSMLKAPGLPTRLLGGTRGIGVFSPAGKAPNDVEPSALTPHPRDPPEQFRTGGAASMAFLVLLPW